MCVLGSAGSAVGEECPCTPKSVFGYSVAVVLSVDLPDDPLRVAFASAVEPLSAASDRHMADFAAFGEQHTLKDGSNPFPRTSHSARPCFN